jgi:Cytochrome C'
MRSNARRIWLGAAVLMSGLFALAGATTLAADVPDDVLAGLIEQDARQINKLLGEPRPEKRIPFIKSSAMMLAAYAQDGMGKNSAQAAKYAALRQNALKVAEAAAAKKLKDAAEPAKALNLNGAGGGDTKPLKLYELHKFDVNDLMAQYKKTAVGGLNIEQDIKDFSKKPGMKPADAILIAARVQFTSDFLENMQPDEGFNPKKPKPQWDEANKRTRTAAEELAEVAKAPKVDAAKLQKALSKLDAGCISCHDTFK